MQPKAKHNKAQHIKCTDISALKSENLKDKCFKIRVQAKQPINALYCVLGCRYRITQPKHKNPIQANYSQFKGGCVCGGDFFLRNSPLHRCPFAFPILFCSPLALHIREPSHKTQSEKMQACYSRSSDKQQLTSLLPSI